MAATDDVRSALAELLASRPVRRVPPAASRVRRGAMCLAGLHYRRRRTIACPYCSVQ